MTRGEHIIVILKQKSLSQGELGRRIGNSGDMIGRYEHAVINPSIEAIIRIADELEVSIDFLVGKTNLELDRSTLTRLEDIALFLQKNKA